MLDLLSMLRLRHRRCLFLASFPSHCLNLTSEQPLRPTVIPLTWTATLKQPRQNPGLAPRSRIRNPWQMSRRPLLLIFCSRLL